MYKPVNKHKQLVDYFKNNFKKGYTPDTLKYSLLSQGHSRTAINRALEEAQKKQEQEKPKITHTIYAQKNYDEIVLEPKEPSFLDKLKNFFSF
jgi:SOS response regulatory protein OraA/RecX